MSHILRGGAHTGGQIYIHSKSAKSSNFLFLVFAVVEGNEVSDNSPLSEVNQGDSGGGTIGSQGWKPVWQLLGDLLDECHV